MDKIEKEKIKQQILAPEEPQELAASKSTEEVTDADMQTLTPEQIKEAQAEAEAIAQAKNPKPSSPEPVVVSPAEPVQVLPAMATVAEPAPQAAPSQ